MENNVREILAFIERQERGASFYKIVRGFGFPGAPYDLNEVLQSFVDEKLVELLTPEDGANALYEITPTGRQILSRFQQ